MNPRVQPLMSIIIIMSHHDEISKQSSNLVKKDCMTTLHDQPKLYNDAYLNECPLLFFFFQHNNNTLFSSTALLQKRVTRFEIRISHLITLSTLLQSFNRHLHSCSSYSWDESHMNTLSVFSTNSKSVVDGISGCISVAFSWTRFSFFFESEEED